MSKPRHVLMPPRSSEDWTAYHAIRRDSIFALHLPDQSYDPNDPDEHAEVADEASHARKGDQR